MRLFAILISIVIVRRYGFIKSVHSSVEVVWSAAALDALTQNKELLTWLRDVVELCRPDECMCVTALPRVQAHL